MVIGIVALLILAIAATGPWRVRDDPWFETSAMLEAVLLGALVLVLWQP